MNTIFLETPDDILRTVADNLRIKRKNRKLSMKELAELSGVSLGSIKRFESTGEISLKSLVKIAYVLDCSDAFKELFTEREILSIQDIIDGKV